MSADGVEDFGGKVDKAHSADLMPLRVEAERFVHESDKLFHRKCLSNVSGDAEVTLGQLAA